MVRERAFIFHTLNPETKLHGQQLSIHIIHMQYILCFFYPLSSYTSQVSILISFLISFGKCLFLKIEVTIEYLAVEDVDVE